MVEAVHFPLWTYRARLIRIIDGDTVDMLIDAGFHGYRHERLRLLGVDAPELRGETRDAGLAARAFIVNWFAVTEPDGSWPFVVRTEKSDAFGRYLATIWKLDGGCLNAALLAAGHAVPYL